ncbi:MAG: DUF2779 domain-containing protein, partial [Candidatus Eremiobacterota bacterium]
MYHITKEIFLSALQCPVLGWNIRHNTDPTPLTLSDKFRLETGIEIEKKATETYPSGILIDDLNTIAAAQKTEKLQNDPDTKAIFEGAFIYKSFVARADILLRNNNGWKMIEVKSSINDKGEFIQDMAYTAMIMELAGLNVSHISLMHLSENFQLGMAKKDLFLEEDHTEEVQEKVKEFKTLLEKIQEITDSPVKPEADLIFTCRKCYLLKKCTGKDIKNHIFDLSRLSQSKFDKLKALGITSIENIPDNFPLTDTQLRIAKCVKSQKPFIGEGLKRALENINSPYYYLDFETVMTAFPLYRNITPYETIPTQFSIHKTSSPANIINHSEYLADPKKDCRRELTESLIKALEDKGSIITYTGYEEGIIKELIKIYPDLSEYLNRIIERLVDLEKIIRENYYHPDF